MSAERTHDDLTESVDSTVCRKCGATFDVSILPKLSPVDCPFCGARQTVPARLGSFLLTDVLGRGGSANVYRARDEVLDRTVAVKVLRADWAGQSAMAALKTEAQAAARLNHPNIVQIYAVETAGPQPYIVMELVDGGRLDQRMAKDGPMNEAALLRVARDVVEGLKAAHGEGLIHGDIKPANVLFTRKGVAKLADFGLAMIRGQRRDEKDAVWGTPLYLSPERTRRQTEDFRSDIYSLGCALYHALAGTPPFEGPSATETVLMRLKNPPPALAKRRPDLTPETVALVGRMMEIDPARRHPTHASLLADIDHALAAAGARDAAAAPPPAAAKKPSAFPVWMRAAAAAFAVAAAAAAIVASRHVKDGRSRQRAVLAAAEERAGFVERAATPAPGETGATETAASPLPVQPFDEALRPAVESALAKIADGRLVAAEDELIALSKSLPRGHGAKPWLAFFYGLCAKLEGDADETARRLKALDALELKPQSDGTPDPRALPQSLARVALGARFSPPPAAAGAPWPAWFEDLAGFVQGVEAYRRDNRAAGDRFMQEYSSRAPADVTWPYALQPLARILPGRSADWERLRGAAASAKAAGRAAEAAAELQALAAKPGMFVFKPDVRALAADLAKAAAPSTAGPKAPGPKGPQPKPFVRTDPGPMTFVWTNTAGGEWGDPANWSPNGYPSIAGDVAVFTNLGLGQVSLNVAVHHGATAGVIRCHSATNACVLELHGDLALDRADGRPEIVAEAALSKGIANNALVIQGPKEARVVLPAGLALHVDGRMEWKAALCSTGAVAVAGTNTLFLCGDGPLGTFFQGTIALADGSHVQLSWTKSHLPALSRDVTIRVAPGADLASHLQKTNVANVALADGAYLNLTSQTDDGIRCLGDIVLEGGTAILGKPSNSKGRIWVSGDLRGEGTLELHNRAVTFEGGIAPGTDGIGRLVFAVKTAAVAFGTADAPLALRIDATEAGVDEIAIDAPTGGELDLGLLQVEARGAAAPGRTNWFLTVTSGSIRQGSTFRSVAGADGSRWTAVYDYAGGRAGLVRAP
jgi:serine/threonine-protein kinase